MQNINKIPKLYNLSDVSQMLGIPLGTLYNMNWRNELPCTKIGKRIKMSEEHILQLVQKGERNNDNKKAIPHE